MYGKHKINLLKEITCLIEKCLYFQKIVSPVESQVICLSKETPIVSVGLRTAEVSYTNQNKTAWKSEVYLFPNIICFLISLKFVDRLFSQSKSQLELSQFSCLWRLWRYHTRTKTKLRENPKSHTCWVDHFPSVYRLSHA
jgi:hypothetical protein